MLFHTTPLAGLYVVEQEPRGDARGFFARYFCAREFAGQGLESRFPQINNSFSARAGTLRGLHYQLPPTGEVKVVRCVRGALWDVAVDLRPQSPTFKRWYGTELTAENRRMLYVPHGFAHAFITLTDDVEAIYLTSEYYAPEAERGVRWNDPAIGIEWPVKPVEISDKDRAWPDLSADYHGFEKMREVA